ncbi:hypothetical protein BpJC7_11700 [Weizmannia acidilactici]|uniref:Uncharacterized protein n=2 Tax=Heyndrickxia TaxID=2837504 RepID=A0A5J4JHB9_9BACI|nr:MULTISPECIES: hypothetical protein [Heyndrickxia]MDL5041411.1 hypothetical protein [Heyndrickxia coagulans]GER67225.1 hypothetical protein BpJC4_16960 [Weizmannia acidilactici]GER69867.1 hypothetical protein BpJC7_11700 [Weizmannia acidilactici]GER73354.1 hypothetical protein BpPP18_14210 [Weizmannia acidilactici]
MKRFSRPVIFTILAAIVTAIVPTRPSAASGKGMIIVQSFYGMKIDYIHEHKKELPNLYKMMKKGTDAKDITAVYLVF